MLQIITHTPIWVFAILFALIALGVMQSRTRAIKVRTVFILPCAMIFLSFWGVYSVSGFELLPVALWISGLFFALMLGLKLAYPQQVRYLKNEGKLKIPGSWVPLLLMMAIFMTKYFVGFAKARELIFADELLFIVTISLLYGVFSGTFLSRSFVMYKASKA